MACIQAHRPLAVILENVVALASKGGRDIAHIEGQLREYGYSVSTQKLNSNQFGVPQSRNRLYIIAFLVQPGNVEEGMPFAFMKTIESTLRRMQTIPAPPLTAFLAPETHPGIHEWRAHRMQTKSEGTNRKENAGCKKYEPEHMEAFLAVGVTDYPPKVECFPSGAHLPQRFFEIAYLQDIRFKHLQKETVHDLNMSLNYQNNPHEEQCFTLTSCSRPWLRQRKRDMTGDEALALQGFGYIRQVKANGTQVFTHAQKFDLAGNAFCSTSFASAFVAFIVVVAVATQG